MKKSVFVLLAALPIMAQQCVVGSVSFGVPAIGVTVMSRHVGVSVFAGSVPVAVVPSPVAYIPPQEPMMVVQQPVYADQSVVYAQPVVVPQPVYYYVPSPVVYAPVFYTGCGHSSMRYAPIHYGRGPSYPSYQQPRPAPMPSPRPGFGGSGRPVGRPQGGPGGGRGGR